MAVKKKTSKRVSKADSQSIPTEKILDPGLLVPPVPKLNLNEDPGLAASVFDRITETNAAALSGGSKDLFPRQEVELIIDGSECAPGVFCDDNGDYFDFRVTLRALSSADELSVFSVADVTEDQVGGAFQMAKKAFYKMNGTRISSDRKDLMWELFGPKGRQLIMRGFGELSSISPAAVGKLQSVSPHDLELED